MLCRSFIGFIFHLEHDRYVFKTVRRIAENKIAFRAGRFRYRVVFFKISAGHDGTEILFERIFAMRFERFSDHLRRKLRFQIFIICYLFVFIFQLSFESLLHAIFFQFCFIIRFFKFIR